VYKCIIYILYYILAYIQHKGDVSLEISDSIRKATCSDTFERGLPAVLIEVTSGFTQCH